MHKTIVFAALAGIPFLLSGCSSDSEAPPRSSSGSSQVSPPSVDLGSETTPSGGAPASSSAASSGQAKPAAGGWGTLKGRFVYDGEAPQPAPLSITKDQEFCGKHDVRNEELVVNAENGGIKNVVVVLYPGPRGKAPEAHPDYEAALKEPVRLDNAGCRFEPHVLHVREGQELIIGNKDEVGHNTNVAFVSGSPFNELIAAQGEIKKVVTASERTPIPAACNIHPWMRAYVLATDHPYAAITDENGEFTIENLPTGEWTFQIWQEKAGYIEKAQRDGQAQDWEKGRTQFAINEGDNDLGEIKLAPAVFE
jgi:hypothetical protein